LLIVYTITSGLYISIVLHFHITSHNQTAQLELYVSKSKNSPPLPTYIILRSEIETFTRTLEIKTFRISGIQSLLVTD